MAKRDPETLAAVDVAVNDLDIPRAAANVHAAECPTRLGIRRHSDLFEMSQFTISTSVTAATVIAGADNRQLVTPARSESHPSAKSPWSTAPRLRPSDRAPSGSS
ncbi:hypothetical protein [Enhygromyxa salina]|uniref:hypothetical protein n=1 Tax=Enhygromyxa salina TaxID=215803 RepID=UPI001969E1B9|nr:hypothetical protein [Enhygromyxa salina]